MPDFPATELSQSDFILPEAFMRLAFCVGVLPMAHCELAFAQILKPYVYFEFHFFPRELALGAITLTIVDGRRELI